MTPITALSLGLIFGALLMLPVAWLFRRRGGEAEAERARLEAVAVKAREILAGSPDGLFLWDRAGGGITCSRKLATLLALADGTQARFDDVLARFDGESARRLKAAVRFLHEEGRRFELVLATADSGGRRLIQAVGARAKDRKGAALAEMVWMRDISAAAKLLVDLSGETDLPEARDLHLRSLLDALPFPVWLRDPDLKVVFTNQAALSARVAAPDDGQAETARAEHRPVTRPQQIETAGEVRTFDVTECPLGEGDEDEVSGLIGYAFAHAETAEPGGDSQPAPPPAPEPVQLPPGAAMAQSVLAGLGIGVAIYDRRTRLVFHNQAFRDMWHLDAEWLDGTTEAGGTGGDGRDFGEILEHLRAERRLPEVPDFRAYKVEQLQQFDAGGDPTGDLMHLPDGRTLRAVSYPMSGGGLAFSYEDVTDQLDLERSVNARDAVQKATLENLHEGIAVFGSDGRLKLTNPTLLELWNLDEGSLTPETHVSDFVELTRPLAAPTADWDTKKGQVLSAMTRREISRSRIERTDGRILEYANVPLPDGAVLISYIDVTDDARLEAALRESAEAFKEANRLKSDFIASLSQEMRTPLTSIIGFADMLCANYFGDLNPRQQEYIRNILETSHGLSDVVANILELAAIEAGQVELEKTTIDIHSLLGDVLKMVDDRARARDVDLDFDVPPDTGEVTVDERRMKQAVFNLLSTAVTKTPPRGRVRLAARRADGWLEVIVADGSPAPAADKAEASGGGEDGGMGLVLVRNFFQLHGGDAEAARTNGRGRTVTCRLPVAVPEGGA